MLKEALSTKVVVLQQFHVASLVAPNTSNLNFYSFLLSHPKIRRDLAKIFFTDLFIHWLEIKHNRSSSTYI